MQLKKDLKILDCWVSKSLWLIVIDGQIPGNIRLSVTPQELQVIDTKNLKEVSIADIEINSKILLSNGTTISYLKEVI